MRRLTLTVLAGGLILATGSALAQAPRAGGPTLEPMRRPTVSPYLDLLAGQAAGGPGLGYQYYRQFLPQQQYRQGILQNQQTLRTLNRDLVEQDRRLQSEISGLSPTGRGSGRQTAGFMTHHKYFSLPGSPQR